MKSKQQGIQAVGMLAAITASMALIVPQVKSQGSTTIKIDGSSTVFPITEAVAEEFQIEKQGGVQVTVGVSGTGGGFKKFCAGQTDISNASRPIKDEEMQACQAAGIEYIELPVAYDALTVVVNPQNPIESITVEELKKMWEPTAEGTITNWNQVNSSWQDAPLALFGPGADSGTFDYFTDEINGEEGASRTDYTPSEDDNVLVQGVANDANALGYFGYAYYEENQDKLKALPVDSGNGPVFPSTETVRDGSYTPLSRPLYIYINAEAVNRSEVKEFVDFYLNSDAELVQEVGYVPLAEAELTEAKNRFANKVLGTASAK
jgi:phosphate transport system substrate-binding protein